MMLQPYKSDDRRIRDRGAQVFDLTESEGWDCFREDAGLGPRRVAAGPQSRELSGSRRGLLLVRKAHKLT